MTDAPNGAAEAAPAPDSAPTNLVPINEAPATPPNPLESSGPEKPQEPAESAKPSASVKDALAKAEAKLKEANEKAKAPEAKPEPKEKVEPTKAEAPKEDAKAADRPRTEDGKFAPKQPAEGQQQPEAKPAQPSETRFHEAPKRFSDDAKQAWAQAPEPVRAEIHRAVKELEEGIGRYREVVEPLKPYIQLAQQHNTTVDRALEQYVTLERKLMSPNPSDKMAALDHVFQYAGINPREWAAQLLNQTPDQVATQQDAVIRELRQEIATLKQHVGGVTQTIQQQREAATLQEVNAFAEAHPRFDELAADIVLLMDTGRAQTLSEAYQLAERLNPAPAKAPQTAEPAPLIPEPAPAADAQTKGAKSITGAPSSGSSPAPKRPPSKSIRESLERAVARAS